MARLLSMEQEFIETMNKALNINLGSEQFGVKELAKEVGLSRSQLHRKLRSITGQTASQFIREFRLQKAMELLKDHVATASEIAYRVGFGSPTYFNTCFSDFYGYPPGEVKYRVANRLPIERKTDHLGIRRDTNRVENIRGIRIKPFRLWVLVGLLIFIPIILGSIYFYKSYRGEPNVLNSNSERNVEKSIAVLPLANWSGNVDLEYVSDGMSDAVISKLSGIKAFHKVIPFASTAQYKNTKKSIPEIAKELGVQNILQGNLQLSGKEIKIKLYLIDGKSNTQLWSKEFSGIWKSDEIFKIQAAVAENVAEIMKVKATTDEIEQIYRIPTENTEAYLLYMEGTYQQQVLDKAGMENAAPFFEKAIAMDPYFIEPYLLLGDNYLLAGLVWGILNEQEAWQKAKRYYEEALIRDKQKDGRLHNSIMSFISNGKFLFEWDFVTIGAYYENSGTKSEIFFADYLRKMGRFQEAMNCVDSLIMRNPTRNVSNVDFMGKGTIYYFQGEQEKALKIFENYNETSKYDYFYLMETAKYYFYMNKITLSKQQLEQLLYNFDDRPPIVVWLKVVHAAIEGNTIIQNESLARLQSQFNDNVSGSPAWFLALYYAQNKDYDKAFDWLQRSYDRHEVEMTWYKEEPILRPLHDDPRYKALYSKMGFDKIKQLL